MHPLNTAEIDHLVHYAGLELEFNAGRQPLRGFLGKRLVYVPTVNTTLWEKVQCVVFKILAAVGLIRADIARLTELNASLHQHFPPLAVLARELQTLSRDYKLLAEENLEYIEENRWYQERVEKLRNDLEQDLNTYNADMEEAEQLRLEEKRVAFEERATLRLELEEAQAHVQRLAAEPLAKAVNAALACMNGQCPEKYDAAHRFGKDAHLRNILREAVGLPPICVAVV